MNIIETEFREVEKILDELIIKDGKELRSAGFQLVDHSARTYHYKNDHLFWDYSFQKEWLVNHEHACVTVRLLYGEPIKPKDAPIITLSLRSEVYQQGQESLIDKRNEQKCPLDYVKSEGIAVLVIKAFEEGLACLPSPL